MKNLDKYEVAELTELLKNLNKYANTETNADKIVGATQETLLHVMPLIDKLNKSN